VKKEERWLVFIMLAVFLTFNILLITSHYHVYTMGAHGGFWSIFTKNFRMSGYDNWSWITISGMRIHFITSRHPLYLTFLYPLYLLNHWLIEVFGHNFAVYFMAAIIVLSAFYAAVFAYRIFREVMELRRFDSTLLTVLLFSFGHILIPSMVPDHFIVSMMFLLMALYICGKKMKKGELLTAWQSLLLTFFTAGMATSNGAKIFLAGLFTNRKKFFTWKYICIGVILPCLLLIGIQQSQYYLLEVPQKAVISNIEKVKRQKDPKGVEEFYKKRNAWQKTHLGQTMSKESMLDWLDTSTPRTRTLVENFFGESIQLHQRYLLKDVAWDRPVFVTYNWITNYVIEAIMVVLFVLGIIFGYRKRFFQILLAWFACDITLHLILGFGITEVYIMASGWAFIIPIGYGYLIKGLSHRYRQMLRGLLLVITIFLWAYNGGLTVNYLLNL
jgi:putative membrane protein